MKQLLSYMLNASIFLLSFTVIAQDLPTVVPPSPTVANLMQFEEVPVSYYTGQPNISIPIYSKALTGDLGINIGLSYNTQGVQINNRSGWTGTSWSLNAGGVISRTVRGEPDEILNASPNKTGIFHLNDYWNYNSLTGAEKAEFNYKVIGETGAKYDNKPDLYQFNFMGYSGRFVILKQPNGTLAPKFISQSGKFDIEFTHNSTYEISAFKIIDPKGYVYYFGDTFSNDNAVERSFSSPFTGSKSQGHSSTFDVSVTQAQQGYYANTAWHLTRVETSNGSNLVTFSYQTIGEGYAASVNHTINRIINPPSDYNEIIANPYNQGILEPKETVAYQNISTPTKKISVITFTRDNTKVFFDVDGSYIHPEIGGRVLKTIRIKNGTTTNKTFTLNYEETSDTSLSPIVLKRVWLTKVTESAGGINYDYNLNYYQKQNLPGFNNNDVRGDSWGYYSGINDGTTYSDDTIKTGLLTSIEYPTGGVKEFVFEHNTYSYYQDELIGSDDYLENPRNSTIANDFTDDFTYIHNGQSSPTLTIDTFSLNFEQDIIVSSWVTANPSQYLNDHIIKISNTNNSVIRFVSLDETNVTLSNMPAGTYTMAFAPNNNFNLANYTITGDYRVRYLQSNTNPTQEMIGGGVRIKDIIFKDNPSSSNAKKTSFIYDDDDGDNDAFNNHSSGVVDSKGDRIERRYTKNTSRYIFGNSAHIPGAFMIRNIQYDVIEEGANVEFSQGSYVGYRHVKVLEQGNGYNTYSYTSPYDYPSAAGTFNFEQPLPKANLDYKRGLMLEQKTYNQAGDILKEVSYKDASGNPNYEFYETLLFNDKSVFRPNCPYIQFYTDYVFYLSGNVQNSAPNDAGLGTSSLQSYGPEPCGAFPVLGNDFNFGWAKLKGTTSKDYFYDSSGNQSVKESRQEFTYNSTNYQMAQQNNYFKEKGVEEHYRTIYLYANNSSSNTSTIKSKLLNLNKVNDILETKVYKVTGINLNETSELLSYSATIYHEFATNLVLPKEVKVSKNNDPLEKRIEFINYDSYGNTLEVKKTNGASISYLYGFNNALPIAKITNATYSSIPNAYKNLSGNLSTSQENSLRSALPNALISIYKYDPLVGIISTSDEKGYKTTYEYDAFNRLEFVRDQDGKILSKNVYNYKN